MSYAQGLNDISIRYVALACGWGSTAEFQNVCLTTTSCGGTCIGTNINDAYPAQDATDNTRISCPNLFQYQYVPFVTPILTAVNDTMAELIFTFDVQAAHDAHAGIQHGQTGAITGTDTMFECVFGVSVKVVCDGSAYIATFFNKID